MVSIVVKWIQRPQDIVKCIICYQKRYVLVISGFRNWRKVLRAIHLLIFLISLCEGSVNKPVYM